MKNLFIIILVLLSFVGARAQALVPEWFFQQGDGKYSGCAPALLDNPQARHEMAVASALIAYSVDKKVFNAQVGYEVEDSFVNEIGEEFVRITIFPIGTTHVNIQCFVQRAEGGKMRSMLKMFYDSTYFSISGIKQNASSEKYSVEFSSGGKDDNVLYFKDIFQCVSEDSVLRTLRYPDSGTRGGSVHGYDCGASLFIAYCKVLMLDGKLPMGISDNKLCY